MPMKSNLSGRGVLLIHLFDSPADISAVVVALGRLEVTMVKMVPITGRDPDAAERVGPQVTPNGVNFATTLKSPYSQVAPKP